jgi:protein gp37
MTKIDWTEETWNPTTGCTKVSDGCKHCYAELMAKRLQAMKSAGYENGFNFEVHPDRLDIPLKRKKPTMYFVNSMSDLFHDDVPDSFIIEVFEVMERCPQHTFQVLTKRAERMAAFFSSCARKRPPANVWLGVTVENQAHGLPRIEHLRRIDASVRFLSCEPLLEDLGTFDLSGIDWVIVGGESGHKARPLERRWALNIRDQCISHDIAFFFKQWGEWLPIGHIGDWTVAYSKRVWMSESRENYYRIGKSAAGDDGKMLDGMFYRDLPKPKQNADRWGVWEKL